MIRAVIFDLDGVLVEAKEWHYESLNRALAPFGYSIGREEHLARYDGLPTWRKLWMLTSERGFPTVLHSLVKRMKQRETIAIVRAKCARDERMIRALAKIRAMGYRLGVASNAVSASVNEMLQRTEIAGCFDAVVTNEDVIRPKPSPEMYLLAAQRLGVEPSDCVGVEDNENGKRAVLAAGMRLVEVEDPEQVRNGLVEEFLSKEVAP